MYWSVFKVATLARLSFPSSILLKSPPRSRSKSLSTLGGVTVVEVDEVGALGRPSAGVDGGDSSIVGAAGRCFFCPPNEKVRPAAFRKPFEDDFGIGGTGMSACSFLWAPRHSSDPPVSAEDGAVEALLLRDELSVRVVLVVFEEPLPLEAKSTRVSREKRQARTYRFDLRPANMLSSAVTSEAVGLWSEWVVDVSLMPPSNGFADTTSVRSRTRKEGPVGAAFSRLSAVDLRLPKATENLGM